MAEEPTTGHVAVCEGCGRRRVITSLNRRGRCYALARQKLGICKHCRQQRQIYAKGECKPCRDAACRGYR